MNQNVRDKKYQFIFLLGVEVFVRQLFVMLFLLGINFLQISCKLNIHDIIQLCILHTYRGRAFG